MPARRGADVGPPQPYTFACNAELLAALDDCAADQGSTAMMQEAPTPLWQTWRATLFLGSAAPEAPMTRNKPHIYRFVIDGLALETLPMARLAAYLADLAKLMGEAKQVHFTDIGEGSGEGSIVLTQQVDADAARAGSSACGPPDATMPRTMSRERSRP